MFLPSLAVQNTSHVSIVLRINQTLGWLRSVLHDLLLVVSLNSSILAQIVKTLPGYKETLCLILGLGRSP